ncbi:MAG: molecular chaperone TorD family protein [Halobacteriales archaeon]
MRPTNNTMTDERRTLDRQERWRDLHVVLATALRHPDEQLKDDLAAGAFGDELAEIATDLDFDLGVALDPPAIDDRGLTEDYVALFEAARTPFAPPAESPYKPWYGERDGGLMGGPPASDMETRYRAIGAEIPDGYPPDHVALQLEYGSYLLEAGEQDAYRAFFESHLDWIPAFRRATDDAAAAAPFHRWAVEVTDAVLDAARTRLGVAAPDAATEEQMVERIDMESTPE